MIPRQSEQSGGRGVRSMGFVCVIIVSVIFTLGLPFVLL